MKVETFSSIDLTKLRNMINDFLAKLSSDALKDIKYTSNIDHSTGEALFCALVIYKD